jgi:hypothetical protein
LIANNNPTIDIVLTKWLQLYDRFEIEFDDIQAALDDVQLDLRTSANGGLSYDAGNNNYAWAMMRVWGTGLDSKAASSDSQIVLVENDGTHGLSNVPGDTAVGRVTLHSPRTSAQTKISWEAIHTPEGSGAVIVRADGAGFRAAAGIVNAVRFFLSSGNIAAGKFRLYGFRG